MVLPVLYILLPPKVKRTVTWDFWLQVFYMNQYPWSSQLKVQRRWRWHRWQFCHQYQQTRGTGGKIYHRCCWYQWSTTWEYLREFLKKFKMSLMLFSGAWGQRWASTLANRSNARHRPNIRAPPRPLPPDICTQSVGICVSSMLGSDS